jgi:hypothetical protein
MVESFGKPKFPFSQYKVQLSKYVALWESNKIKSRSDAIFAFAKEIRFLIFLEECYKSVEIMEIAEFYNETNNPELENVKDLMNLLEKI